MKKIMLEQVIYKNYLKTSLTSIFFIELALIIIYFNVNSNMINKSLEFILNDIRQSTYLLVRKETQAVNKKFNQIEQLSNILQEEQQRFFENPYTYIPTEKPIFKTANSGVYYKENDNGGSSVVVSRKTKITPEFYSKLEKTEAFDSAFKTIVDSDEVIVASYFNSHDDLNRYYPFIENSFLAFPSEIKMSNYNFYYEANLEHNPSKGVVWTDVYLDPAGQGWLLSAIVPIYNKEKLEGVTGIDVTINSFINSFLNIKLPYDGQSFVINEKGDIVAMPKMIEKVLGMKEVSDVAYSDYEKIEANVFKEKHLNILNFHDKKVANVFDNIIHDREYSHTLMIHGKEYMLFTDTIEKTQWHIISLVLKENVIKKVKSLEDDYTQLGFLMIASIIVFYFLFFLYLHHKAKSFVKQINTPLKKMIEVTKNLGKTKDINTLKPCGIVEIDELNINFNQMIKELDKRTRKWVESEANANTDSLTGVFNRRFFRDFSERYMKITRRKKDDFSLLIVDIDDFKSINDTYGHHTGDKIIKKFITIAKEVFRENDLIIRYGGDEFIVLLPDTKLEQARGVAQKLIDKIKEINQLESKELIFTVSIGTAELTNDDQHIELVVARADVELYKAKSFGKNCVS